MSGRTAGSAFRFCRPIRQNPASRRGKFSRSQQQVSSSFENRAISSIVRYWQWEDRNKCLNNLNESCPSTFSGAYFCSGILKRRDLTWEAGISFVRRIVDHKAGYLHNVCVFTVPRKLVPANNEHFSYMRST